MAAIEVASLGPSKKPKPCMQAYSVPDRSTPCSTIAVPEPSSSRFPDTCRPAGAPAAPAG